MEPMPIHDPLPPPAPAPSGIANPHAWARYRRIMRWMALLAAICVAVTLGTFRWLGGPMPLAMVIATSVGVFLTVMVGTGLMSLVFLSAGSGHDADAADPFDEHPR
jgi:hypothetical protein